MKKGLSLALVIMMVFSLCSPALADGKLLHDYGSVRISIPISEEYMAEMEKEFRQFVSDRAAAYLKYINSEQEWYKYYYEAAEIKHTFDGEKANKDLPYNTTMKINDAQYDQQTREIVLGMLSKNIEAKASEMNSLSEAEKAVYFPGIAFDPAKGTWTVNNSAVIAQEYYNLEFEQAIQSEADAMLVVAGNTLIDGVLLLSGASVNETAMKVKGIIVDIVNEVWESWRKIEHLEAKKYLKNAYREALVQAVAEAQKNVDNQMYSGLIQIRDELKAQESRLSHDDTIMLEVLEKVLKTIREGKPKENAVIEQEIDALAEALVSNIGLPEEIPLSWQEKNNAKFLGILKTSLKTGIKLILEETKIDSGKTPGGKAMDALSNQTIEESINLLVDEVFEMLEEIGGIDADGSSTVSSEEIINLFTEKLVLDGDVWNELLSPVFKTKGTTEALEAARNKLKNAKIQENISKELDGDSAYTEKLGEKVSDAQKEVEKLEKKQKSEQTILASLISNAMSAAQSAFRLYTDDVSLENVLDNEVLYSYYSSLMYRSMQLSKEADAEIRNDAISYSLYGNVESAELDDLRSFVDTLYALYNTDLLGHAYYCTLAEGYAWETSYGDRIKDSWNEACQVVVEAHTAAIDEMGVFLSAVGFSASVWVPYIQMIGEGLGVADYLKRVQEDSQYGGWLKNDDYPNVDYMKVYNYIGDYMTTTKMPEKFDLLFK